MRWEAKCQYPEFFVRWSTFSKRGRSQTPLRNKNRHPKLKHQDQDLPMDVKPPNRPKDGKRMAGGASKSLVQSEKLPGGGRMKAGPDPRYRTLWWVEPWPGEGRSLPLKREVCSHSQTWRRSCVPEGHFTGENREEASTKGVASRCEISDPDSTPERESWEQKALWTSANKRESESEKKSAESEERTGRRKHWDPMETIPENPRSRGMCERPSTTWRERGPNIKGCWPHFRPSMMRR